MQERKRREQRMATKRHKKAQCGGAAPKNVLQKPTKTTKATKTVSIGGVRTRRARRRIWPGLFSVTPFRGLDRNARPPIDTPMASVARQFGAVVPLVTTEVCATRRQRLMRQKKIPKKSRPQPLTPMV